ncbi:MAG: hypothetical protein AAGA08_08290 [Pseudomonadota bacterium]
MPDKVKITVEKAILPFAETKSKGVPAWFECRSGLARAVVPICFKKTMELDGRKWKKKVIEDGIYAVARADLQLFATQLTNVEKSILKTLPKKDQAKKNFPKDKKAESPEVKKALDSAETQVKKLYKQMEGKIKDKVSLALEEVESDKGDNKKALAAGKDALKKFDSLQTNGMFSDAVKSAATAMKTLAIDLNKHDDEDDSFKAALRKLRSVETDFEKTAKTTQNVAKYILVMGNKLAKDKKADSELQNFGRTINKGPVTKALKKLVDNVDDLGDDLDKLVNFVAKGEASDKEVIAKAGKFKSDHSAKEKSGKAAVKAVRAIAEDFKKLEKKLK